MNFQWVILSFVGGIALESIFHFGISFGFFLIFLSLILLLFLRREFFSLNFFRFLILFFVFVGLGVSRCAVDNQINNDIFLDSFVGEKKTFEVVVVEEPDQREKNTKLVGEVIEAETNSKNKILITVPFYPSYVYGDRIRVSGVLETPKNFKNDTGRTFNYIDYLAKDNILYTMFYPKTELVSQGNGFWVKEKLFQIKNNFLSKLEESISEPQVSLLGGLLLGVKQSLGESLQEDFRRVGLIHIIVLSGYNVTIIADFILGLFSFFPYLLGLSLGAFGIILFAIMVGGSATIVRASIMALLVVLAKATGRTSDVTRALFLAGFLMVLINPKIVVFDPSFQLSFMATLGLIVLSPKIYEYLKFIPEKYNLRESAVATVSTQIFVLPLLLYMMGELSIVAVIVNLLVLMFVPMTMFFGFLAGIFSFISSWLALPFSYLTYFLLSYELKVVEVFANLPFASLEIAFFPFWLMLVWYLFYFLLFTKMFFSKNISS
ncbi:MAG: ComEC/Rec2 family competence protein [Patescibacteria group bacterium]